jgi:hypothetical protein
MFGKVERHGKVSRVRIFFFTSLLVFPDLSCSLLYIVVTLAPLHSQVLVTLTSPPHMGPAPPFLRSHRAGRIGPPPPPALLLQPRPRPRHEPRKAARRAGQAPARGAAGWRQGH